MAVINLENDSTYSALLTDSATPINYIPSSTPSPYHPQNTKLFYSPNGTIRRVYPFHNAYGNPISFNLTSKAFVAFISSQALLSFAELNHFYQPPSQGIPSGKIGHFSDPPFYLAFNSPYYPNTITFLKTNNTLFSLSIPFPVNADSALFSVKIVYKNNTNQLLFLFTCNNQGYSTTPQFTASYILNKPPDFPLIFYPHIFFYRANYFAINY